MLSDEDDTGHVDAIGLLKQGTYAMSYTMELNYPDFEYTVKVVTASNGSDYVFQSEGEIPMAEYLKTRIIEKDGYTYYVDDVNKIYTDGYSGADEYEPEDGMALDFSGIGEALETGEEEFNGFVCSYEDYESETGVMRFYFGLNKELVEIKGTAQTLDAGLVDNMYGDMIMLVDYFGPVIPAGIFDIPSDYDLIG